MASPTARTSTLGSASGLAGSRRADESLIPLGRHLADYLRVLYKRRWIAIPVFLIVAAGVIGWTFTTTPIYEARTQLLIEVENPNVVTFQEVLEQERATTDYYETQYSILRSRTLARKALDTLELWNHPEFGGASPVGDRPTVRGRLEQGVSRIFSFAVKATAAAPTTVGPIDDKAETTAQAAAIDRFLGQLRIEPVRNSRLVDVAFRSASPDVAASAANALARAYVALLLDFRYQASKEASDWLAQRLAEQGKNVESAELELQRYREKNDAVAMDARNNIVSQRLADLSAAVTRAHTERITKETLFNEVRALQRSRQPLDTAPAILANTYIQQLKSEVATLQQQQSQLSQRLADRHPELIKVRSALQAATSKLEAETNKIVKALENDYRAAVAQENRLAGAVEAQKRELLDQDRKAIQFEALQRGAASDRQLFESLLQRAKETGVSGELTTSNIRIVDAADKPRVPIEPRKARGVLLAISLGSLLALGFAFFFEYMDKRIKSPDEVKALDLPFLGLLPAVRRLQSVSGTSPERLATHFAEALKSLRTKLLVGADDDRPRTLLISSTGPHEGKTSIAVHLSVALAKTARRVLLIDADMRQPKVHELFGIDRSPGLAEVLQRSSPLANAVYRSTVLGLNVLSAGERPDNSAELLASKRFGALLESVREHFEWIVIDSPPVMAVTDPCVIAPQVDGVLFVVGSEMTTPQSLQNALEELEAVNAKFAGTLLNRVTVHRDPYFYSDYYRSEYGKYYKAPRTSGRAGVTWRERLRLFG